MTRTDKLIDLTHQLTQAKNELSVVVAALDAVSGSHKSEAYSNGYYYQQYTRWGFFKEMASRGGYERGPRYEAIYTPPDFFTNNEAREYLISFRRARVAEAQAKVAELEQSITTYLAKPTGFCGWLFNLFT